MRTSLAEEEDHDRSRKRVTVERIIRVGHVVHVYTYLYTLRAEPAVLRVRLINTRQWRTREREGA